MKALFERYNLWENVNFFFRGFSSTPSHWSDSASDPTLGQQKQEMSYWQSYSIWQSYDDSNTFSHKLPPEVFPQGLNQPIHVEDELELIGNILLAQDFKKY